MTFQEIAACSKLAFDSTAVRRIADAAHPLQNLGSLFGFFALQLYRL